MEGGLITRWRGEGSLRGLDDMLNDRSSYRVRQRRSTRDGRPKDDDCINLDSPFLDEVFPVLGELYIFLKRES